MTNVDFKNSEVQTQLSIPKIIVLGLTPGVVMTLLGIFFASPAIGINFNVLLAVMLGFLFGKIPVCLGILAFVARKGNKKIKDLLLYNEKVPTKKMIVSIVIPLLIAIAAFVLIVPVETKLWGNTFDFFPDWFRLDKTVISEFNYLKITLILTIIVNGFVGPMVEEMYFRGYLLPRMDVFGKFAPLVNTIIFSLYHFFTPWQNITRIIGVTPMVYSVWLNKNYKIGSYVHCILNICGDIPLWILLFGL
jgi:membrane protease YdiL (CAAX protease family)